MFYPLKIRLLLTDMRQGWSGYQQSAQKTTSRASGRASLMSFSMPLNLYYEMESGVEHSFLFRNTWKALSK
jgi:hypothetical protein